MLCQLPQDEDPPLSNTRKILDADDRYVAADDSESRELAQATYGLVSAAAFRETRERLEHERQHRERTEASEAKKREKREAAGRQAKSGLSVAPRWPPRSPRTLGLGGLGCAERSGGVQPSRCKYRQSHVHSSPRRSESRRRRRRAAHRRPSYRSMTRTMKSSPCVPKVCASRRDRGTGARQLRSAACASFC